MPMTDGYGTCSRCGGLLIRGYYKKVRGRLVPDRDGHNLFRCSKCGAFSSSRHGPTARQVRKGKVRF